MSDWVVLRARLIDISRCDREMVCLDCVINETFVVSGRGARERL